jgi:hypothetical protein
MSFAKPLYGGQAICDRERQAAANLRCERAFEARESPDALHEQRVPAITEARKVRRNRGRRARGNADSRAAISKREPAMIRLLA